MTHVFSIRMPEALLVDLEDAAAANQRSVNQEIIARLLAPQSRSSIDYGHYEGRLPLAVLALRGEQPEDFGPMLEYWRAKRDVSRKWLATQLQISSQMLALWESAYREVPTNLRDGILDSLEWLDTQFPQLQYRAQQNELVNVPGEFAKEKAELDAMDINTEIDWINPGGWSGCANPTHF